VSDSRAAGDLNQGRLLLRLVRFGIPLVLGMFFHSLFNLVDLIIVGKIGPSALAAVNTATLINMIPMLMGTGVNNASIAVIARNFGMRRYNRANANTMQSFITLVFLSIVVGVPSYIYADELNRMVGSSGDALPDANSYLEIMSLGLFTMFALMQVTAVLRAGGNASWPMILLIGANVLNVVLTIIMVHGWEPVGIPAMGVPGAAWSTVIARGLFAIFGLYLITRPTAPVKLILRRIRIRFRMQWNLLRIGIPSSMQYIVRVLAYGALLRLVTYFGEGEAMHAALAVGFRLDMLATFTGAGWGAAAAAMVGQALGAGNYERARAAGWWASGIDALTMAAIGVGFYIYAPELMAFFGEDPKVNPEFEPMWLLGIEYLQIAVFGYAFAGIGITLAQSLNGAGSTKTPLLLDTIVFLVIQVPLAWWIATKHADLGYDRPDLWWSIVAVTALAAGLYAFVWNHGHWRFKRIH
jgi:putative MATE family efflux protein